MISDYPFNSGMNGLDNQPKGEYEEINFFENERGILFTHNMYKPYTVKEIAIINKAEVIFAQPPTSAGIKKLEKRAGVQHHGTWKDFLLAIRNVAIQFKKPMWVLSSLHDAKILKPDRLRFITLYGYKSALAVWNDDGNYDDIESVNKGLSERYESVYDFSCGYGSNIRNFRYIIGSDISKKCLGYVKKEILTVRQND